GLPQVQGRRAVRDLRRSRRPTRAHGARTPTRDVLGLAVNDQMLAGQNVHAVVVDRCGPNSRPPWRSAPAKHRPRQPDGDHSYRLVKSTLTFAHRKATVRAAELREIPAPCLPSL